MLHVVHRTNRVAATSTLGSDHSHDGAEVRESLKVTNLQLFHLGSRVKVSSDPCGDQRKPPTQDWTESYSQPTFTFPSCSFKSYSPASSSPSSLLRRKSVPTFKMTRWIRAKREKTRTHHTALHCPVSQLWGNGSLSTGSLPCLPDVGKLLQRLIALLKVTLSKCGEEDGHLPPSFHSLNCLSSHLAPLHNI